jgi:hypothetical protein
MQDELKDIKELAQGCLDNLNERHYFRSPNEANTIDNLKNIVIIVNEYPEREKEREKERLLAKRFIIGPHYMVTHEEWLEEWNKSKEKKDEKS